MQDRLKRTTLLILAAAILLLTSALALLSWSAVVEYERRLLPEIEEKAVTVGKELARRLAQGVVFNGRVETLRGVPEVFDKTLEQNPELAFITLRGADGRKLAERMSAAEDAGLAGMADTLLDLELPITVDDEQVGSLHLGISSVMARRILQDMSYDVLTVLAIALLITFGILSFLVQTRIAGRIDAILGTLERIGQGDFRVRLREGGRDRISRILDGINDTLETVRRTWREALANLEGGGKELGDERRALIRIGERNRLDEPAVDDTPVMSRLVAMRLVVFVFFLAEELTRPFLPLYIKELSAASASPSFLVSLPLSLFLFTAAAAQPWGGAWAGRIGRRRTFLIAATVSVIGMAATALVTSYWALLACRLICALGYGAVFVTCQGFAVDNTTPRTRARGMAMFVGGVMAAAVCGPSIGGIIADYFGFRMTLMIAAGVALVAVAVGQSLMQAGEAEVRCTRAVGWREILSVIANRRLLAMILLVSIPAKIVLAGVLFYLTPVYLTALGESQAVIGRVMMVYGVATVLIGPIAARYADLHWNKRHWFVGAGALVSGCGLLPILWMPTELWVLVLGISALGIGQALSLSPQLALVPEIAAEQCHQLGPTVVLGVFRLVERAGGAMGPFVAALLADAIGNASAVASIGQMVLLGGLLFLASMVAFQPRQSAGAEG